MAGNFRLVYPPKARMTFDGGLNNQYERSIIAENESPDCANVRFYNGAVGTRFGAKKFNTQAIGSFAGDFLGVRHDDTGNETMVVGAGGSFYYASNTTFVTIPSAQSLFTAGLRFGHAEYENKLFLGNGGQIPYKYDGVAFTRHGVYPPTATSTVNSQATGALTGDYQYKISNVNTALVESDVGPTTATFTAASGTLRVTLSTFAVSYGVAARNIYRTVASGTVFKRVATVSDNTTTTYDDNIADSALGATAPTDNGVPPKFNVVRYHQNRLFTNDVDNPNYLRYSNLNDPYTFASTNFIKMGDGTSDIITGVDVYANNILVRCVKSVFLVYMPDVDDANWVTTRLQIPFGSKSPYGLIEFEKALLFPVVQAGKFIGFAKMEGIGVTPSTTFLTTETAGSILESDRISPDMLDIQESYQSSIYGFVYDNVGYFSVTSGNAQTANNKVWVYQFGLSNLSKQQFASWSPDTGINANQFALYNGLLYYVSSTANGQVYQYEVNNQYNDDGVAINSYFWTKEISVSGDNNTFNDFRYVKMLVDKAGSYEMNLNVRINSDSGEGDVQEIDLSPSGSVWGTMIWGTGLWGGGDDQEDITVFLGSKRGERIQFKFTNQNTINQRFKVHGLKFYYNRKGWR